MRLRASPIPRLLAGIILVSAACTDHGPPMIGLSTSQTYVQAALLAMADAAGEGTPVPYVVVPDSGTQAATAISASRRIVAEPAVIAVVGHSNSTSSLAASQVYNAHRVVQIAPHSSAVVYSAAGPFSFRLVPPDDRQGRFLAAHVRDLADNGRVAILYVNDDYGRGLRAALVDELGDGAVVVLDLPHTQSPPDPDQVRHLAEALEAARPDIIVWLGRAAVLDQFITAIRSALPRTPILGSDGVAAVRQLPRHDDRWDGVRYVDFVDLDSGDAIRRFRRRYLEVYGTEPSGPHALNYDAVALLLTALEDGARTGPDLRAYLLSLGRSRPPFHGITGPIQFSSGGDVDRDYVMAIVTPEHP